MWACEACGHRFVPGPFGEQRCPICKSVDAYPEPEPTVPLPQPVKSESRNCFGLEWYSTEADADRVANYARERGETVNGGFMHGMAVGRETEFDTEVDGQRLYAVSRR